MAAPRPADVASARTHAGRPAASAQARRSKRGCESGEIGAMPCVASDHQLTGSSTTTPACGAGGDPLPLDVGFGEVEPTLPTAPPLNVAGMLLQRHLPSFMRDAYRAPELADRTLRLAEDASVDALTSLANRRQPDRLLARLLPEDML